MIEIDSIESIQAVNNKHHENTKNKLLMTGV